MGGDGKVSRTLSADAVPYDHLRAEVERRIADLWKNYEMQKAAQDRMLADGRVFVHRGFYIYKCIGGRSLWCPVIGKWHNGNDPEAFDKYLDQWLEANNER